MRLQIVFQILSARYFHALHYLCLFPSSPILNSGKIRKQNAAFGLFVARCHRLKKIDQLIAISIGPSYAAISSDDQTHKR